jgi:cytochrome P450
VVVRRLSAAAAQPHRTAVDEPLRSIRDLPGPRGLPVLGNLHQIRRDRLHLIAERWSRRYGDYFRIRIGAQPFVVVSNAEAFAAILRDRPYGFQRTSRISRIAEELGFTGVFSSNGAAWRRQRPMVMAAFDPGHVKAYFPTLVKVTDRFLRRWQRAVRSGRDIELLPDLMRFTVDVTAGLAFGSDINTLESDREVIQTHLDKVFPKLFQRLLAPLPYWRRFKLPSDRELDRHLLALHAAVSGFIDQARARLDQDPALRLQPGNLIEAMIAARDEPGSGLDDRDVAGNVLTMLLAGEDTTANTLGWMLYLLHRHPSCLAAARAAVEDALGQDPYPTRYEQLSSLDYIEACAQETMRLKPVAPIQMQQAIRDGVVDDIVIPAGTVLMCLTRPAAVDERHFPQAQSFRPERWLAGGSAARAGASAKRMTMSFGGGPRICPGRYLAMQEIKIAMAMILANFDILEVGPPGGGEAQERLSFTMAPVALRLRLAAR